MKLTEKQEILLDFIVDKSLDIIYEQSKLFYKVKNAIKKPNYKDCFRKCLQKFNIRSIKDLDAEQKRNFFKYVGKVCK